MYPFTKLFRLQTFLLYTQYVTEEGFIIAGHEESYNPPPEYLPTAEEVLVQYLLYCTVFNDTVKSYLHILKV